MRNKYGAKKVHTEDGETYDSKHEYERGLKLKEMESAAKISNLKRQVKFELIPAQKDLYGKSIERACNYIADYVYNDEDGALIVEDCKGFHTPDYVIKRKLMLYVYGIRVIET